MSRDRPSTAELFSRQAEAYAASPSHAAGADLDIVTTFADPQFAETALDLATGPGHTAARLAERAGPVIGLDLAAGMVKLARRRAAAAGKANLRYLVGDVAALPFPSGAFDLATCRIAPHHFADIAGFLAEAARVLRPGGRLVVEDSLGPDEPAAAAFLEDIERRRDPTHVHSLSLPEWHAACAAAGLAMVRETVYRKHHAYDLWIARTGLREAEIAAVSARILAAPAPLRDAFFEIEEGRVAALNDNKLIFRAEVR